MSCQDCKCEDKGEKKTVEIELDEDTQEILVRLLFGNPDMSINALIEKALKMMVGEDRPGLFDDLDDDCCGDCPILDEEEIVTQSTGV